MTNKQGDVLEKIIQYFVLGVVVIVLTVLTFTINRYDSYSIEQRRIDSAQDCKIESNNVEAVKNMTEVKTELQNTNDKLKDIKVSVERVETKIDRITNKQSLATDKAIEDYLASGGK